MVIPVPYSELYLMDYPTVDCECPDRVAGIYYAIADICEFIEPLPVNTSDLLLCHSRSLVDSVRSSRDIFEVACLSAGGAVKAAQIAFDRPSFALIRPPGHHAGRNFNGGFCFFNNIAIALKKLLSEGTIRRALIIDIDLHYGNGTDDIFKDDESVDFRNISARTREDFFEQLDKSIRDAADFDIVGCSAGFDTYIRDWGETLFTEDYKTIGSRLASCHKHVFSVLEGGYYLTDLGRNVRAFLDGFLEVCS